ncbi:NAD-dependent epimerase/dehydratase family protein [uncultured Tyzzerella sp.]|uniref:NAD-dependent epimerase/dehydratase family protein n=1 Tax=uncultured Tyzzerella sp. TaxID=2321398 RepID=UPI0029432DA9|nr:NAD-dependent epimerase/dehydratase family protein [uncultured Tyzzerella sp.]
MAKILVTGGTGFIGSNLCNRLVDLGYNVSIITREISNYNNIKNILDKLDIFIYDNNIDNLIKYFNSNDFDLVIHLAASSIIEHTKDTLDCIIDSDLKFAMHILEAMRYSNCNKILNTSTYFMHYKNEHYNPSCLYAAMKKTFEDMLQFYNEDYNISYVTIELFDTYGPNDTRNKILNLIYRYSLSNDILNMSEGYQVLDLTYIDDVINAYLIGIEMLLNNGLINKKYSLKSENRVSIRELVKLYEKVSNKKVNVNYGALHYRKRTIMLPYSDVEILPTWKPKYSLEEGLKIFILSKIN